MAIDYESEVRALEAVIQRHCEARRFAGVKLEAHMESFEPHQMAICYVQLSPLRGKPPPDGKIRMFID